MSDTRLAGFGPRTDREINISAVLPPKLIVAATNLVEMSPRANSRTLVSTTPGSRRRASWVKLPQIAPFA